MPKPESPKPARGEQWSGAGSTWSINIVCPQWISARDIDTDVSRRFTWEQWEAANMIKSSVGFKPESVQHQASKLVASLIRENGITPLDPGFQLRPLEPEEYEILQGVEAPDGGEPLIACDGQSGMTVNVCGQEAVLVVDRNGVQVIFTDNDEGGQQIYAYPTPFAQGQAIAREAARCSSIEELTSLGFTQIV